MKFEWGPKKSTENKKKHGIEFQVAQKLWQDENRVEIYVPHPVEDRMILIARLDGKPWTAVFTMRNDSIRIISVRRSRTKEVKLYEEETG